MASLASGGGAADRGVAAGQQENGAGPSGLLAADREPTVLQRHESAQERLDAAGRRDAIAEDRDVVAVARDHAADARDLATQQAAGHRRHAAEDRVAAADDRAQAALERRRSRDDREALAFELQRAQNRHEQALRHQHRAEKLARTLQHTLSPPRLPKIDGLEVAVHYEPFASEEVGGDFYDLFPLASGRSAFFLGDVCGKGPDAAAVTSLARYTMRTAAMLHEDPEEILMDLNAALLMEIPESMQTCTVVYGEIDMSADLATVRLAVAGHPAPLIVRADGGVEATPARGTLLGVVAAPDFHTCELQLAVEDALVIHSDGIHDAAIGGVPIDEEAVAGLLAGGARAGAAVLVARLVDALRGSDRPLRDDVAIMAVRRTAPAG